jgi:hypothetical protein
MGMQQTIALAGLVPCVPNVPHGDHNHSGFNFGAATEKIQSPGSWGCEEMSAQMDLKIPLQLLPNLVRKLAEEKGMLDCLSLTAKDTKGWCCN